MDERGLSGHTGTGMLRDGAKSAAAIYLGLDLLAITPHQIKSGAGLAAVRAWLSFPNRHEGALAEIRGMMACPESSVIFR